MKRNLPESIVRLLKAQVAVAIVLPSLALLFSGELAWSIWIGATINLIAQGIFAWFAFRHRGARSAALIAQAFARGESIKMVLIAVLLAVALSQIESILPLWVLFGLLAVQSVFWFFPLIDRRRESTALRD